MYLLSKFRGYEEFILVEIADKYMLNNCMTFVSISIYRKTESLIIWDDFHRVMIIIYTLEL